VREDAKDIKVGTVIALMVAEGEDWKSVEIPKSSDASSPPQTPSSEQTSKPGSGGNSSKELLEFLIIVP
jgi:pyruvate/2-oxoglutarate dehydrogenase complex dihydrolipoamide acyltransferase (E2) component